MHVSRFTFLAALALALAVCPFAPANASEPAVVSGGSHLDDALEAIRADFIKADIFFIASDELGGRDTPSNGQRVAARFIRDRLQRLGWQPGAQDGYLFEWTRDGAIKMDSSATQCSITDAKGDKKLAFGTDYFRSVRGFEDCDLDGVLCFAGKGDAKELEGKSLKGKWALCVDSDVGVRERERAVKGAGALGLVVVPSPGFAGESYDSKFKSDVKSLREGTVFGGGGRKKDEAPFATLYLASGALNNFDASKLALGADLDAHLHYVAKVVPLMLENVVGLWPGSDPELKKEVIIISAHYDHVGIGRDGQIYNGADDNGSGTCGLMAIAEALAKNGPLPRTVMLTWVSGEEKGLWGSEAWTKHPWLPDGMKPLCDINIDMIGRNAPDKLLITPTHERPEYNGLVRLAEKNGPLEGFPKLGSADEYWHRSDQMNFSVNLKIPVTFLFSDVHEDYHKPTDKPEKIDCDKIRRVARLVVRMLWGMQEKDLDLK